MIGKKKEKKKKILSHSLKILPHSDKVFSFVFEKLQLQLLTFRWTLLSRIWGSLKRFPFFFIFSNTLIFFYLGIRTSRIVMAMKVLVSSRHTFTFILVCGTWLLWAKNLLQRPSRAHSISRRGVIFASFKALNLSYYEVIWFKTERIWKDLCFFFN